MKATFFGPDMSSKLDAVTLALPSKPVTPAQSCVKVEATNDPQPEIRLTAADSSICVEARMPIRSRKFTEIADPGDPVLIPGHEFKSFISRADNWTEMETSPTRVKLTCVRYRMALPAVDPSAFPEFKTLDKDKTVTISCNADKLRSAIERVLPFASLDENRQLLTGVNLQLDDDGLRLTALDGCRLSTVLVENAKADAGETLNATMTGRCAKVMAALVKAGPGGPCTIEIDGSVIRYTCNYITMSAVLLQGQYIDFWRIIPQGGQHRCTCRAGAVRETLDRVAILGIARTFRLTFEENQLTIACVGVDGDLKAACDVKVQGIPQGSFEIAFNGKYLSDCLKAVGQDDIEIWMNGEYQPAIMFPKDGTPRDSWLTLVLPVRVMH